MTLPIIAIKKLDITINSLLWIINFVGMGSSVVVDEDP